MNSIFSRTQLVLVTGSFAVLLLLGCKDSHSHTTGDEADHHHGEELKTEQIFVLTDRFEVFAEHRAAIAETPTKFVTHVTDLQTGEPRKEGPITFIVESPESAPFEEVDKEPKRPGIYETDLRFPKAGVCTVRMTIPVDGKETIVSLPPITVFATEHDALHAKESEALEGITFLKEQQWKIQAKVDPVTKRKLVERVQVVGQTRAKPGLSAAVTAPLAGQIAVPDGRTLPVPGTRVEAGEILAVLRPRFSDAAARFVEIEAEFGRAEAVLKQAETAYERTKKLAAAQAKSERELQEAEVALASARARQAAASALRSTYASNPKPGSNSNSNETMAALELRAPIAGIVTTVAAGLGEPANVDQVLFTVLNPETVWIEARVPEVAATRLEGAKDALCEVMDGSGRVFSIAAENGRMIFLGLEVNPETRTIPLVYELKKSNARLRIGQTVRLHVETATAHDALAIPESALVEEGGLFVAFVQVSGETFQKRELQLGIRDGQWVQVLGGLNERDRVVTRGAYAIRLASASSVAPAHGHAH